MNKKQQLPENTIIDLGKSIPLAKYRLYFEEKLGIKTDSDFQNWLNTQNGKTLKEAIKVYGKKQNSKTIAELLTEERFNFVKEKNKEFILEFSKEIKLLGYDFDGNIGSGFCWGNYMIIYSQNGIKGKKVIARIFIMDNGVIVWGNKEYNFKNSIVLRLFFTNIDKHIEYIENAPLHLKKRFINDFGICNHCGEKCHNRKIYTIGGRNFEKCGYAFEFHNPQKEHIVDYINILKEFYGKKRIKE